MPECYNSIRPPGLIGFQPGMREGTTMMFFGITAFYVAAASTFYWYLMATAVDESDLQTASPRHWRHARPYRPTARRVARNTVSHWRSAPRLIPIPISAGRRLDWRTR